MPRHHKNSISRWSQASLQKIGIGIVDPIQKHHPDKNEDKEKAKVLFTQITEAYTGKLDLI